MQHILQGAILVLLMLPILTTSSLADIKLSKTTTAKEYAKGICQAVSGYIFSNQNRSMGIEHIQVIGPTGIVVVSRRGLDDRCETR